MKIHQFTSLGMFCDSVRSELGGFKTIVGVYAGQFNVEKFPHKFAQLSVYVKTNHAKDAFLKNASIKLFIDEQELISQDADSKFIEGINSKVFPDGCSLGTFNTRLSINNLSIDKQCVLHASITINDEETEVASLVIREKVTPQKSK